MPEYDVTVTLVRRVRAESAADALTQVGDVLRHAFGEENAGIEAASVTRVNPPGLGHTDA